MFDVNSLIKLSDEMVQCAQQGFTFQANDSERHSVQADNRTRHFCYNVAIALERLAASLYKLQVKTCIQNAESLEQERMSVAFKSLTESLNELSEQLSEDDDKDEE